MQPVADLDILKRDLFFPPVLADHAGGLWGEIEQRPDRRSRALARAKLHHLAKQDQYNNHRARLEIDPDMTFRISESVRENLRHKHGNHAEQIRRADAHGDEGEHVQAAVDHRLDAAHEERPAGPQDDRRAEDEFHPKRHPLAQDVTDESEPHKGAHGQHQKRNRQHGADPKAALEIDQLRVRPFVVGRYTHGLERHAALRTITRRVAHDFRMHRTGVFGALGQGHALLLVRPGDEMLRIGDELVVALLRAEVIRLARVLQAGFARIQWHSHPADRIGCHHLVILTLSFTAHSVAVFSSTRALSVLHIPRYRSRPARSVH